MLDRERSAMADEIQNEIMKRTEKKTEEEADRLPTRGKMEIQAASQNENIRTSVMWTGKKRIKLTKHYGSQELTGIFKEMIDGGLF